MDVSRRDRDRVYHVGPRGNIRITKLSTEEDQDPPSIARPYAQMDRPRPLLKSHNFYNTNYNSGISTSRRFRGEHPYLMRSPVQDDDLNVPPNNIPQLLPSEDEGSSGPRPLFSDEYSSGPRPLFPDECSSGPRPLFPDECISGPRPLFSDEGSGGPRPLFSDEGISGPRPLFSDEGSSGPRPLFSDDVIQKLRESLRQTAARHEDLSTTEWDYDYEENTYSPAVETERMTYEEYLEEEEKTKQTIDEIIMVAQALREKIQREEEIRRACIAAAHAENSNSRPFMLGAAPPMPNPQPKIPSLLDLHVEPPEEILIAANRHEPEYKVPDICWNCDRRGHRYTNCKYKKMKKFCFRCGKRGYDISSCPCCTVA